MQARAPADMAVVTTAKQLCGYVMTVTNKSPKQYRFSFVSRLQNLALELVECLFRANDTYIGAGCLSGNIERRREWQQQASTSAKLLAYVAMLAADNKCILPKQYEQIAHATYECQHLLTAWIKSDQRRLAAKAQA